LATTFFHVATEKKNKNSVASWRLPKIVNFGPWYSFIKGSFSLSTLFPVRGQELLSFHLQLLESAHTDTSCASLTIMQHTQIRKPSVLFFPSFFLSQLDTRQIYIADKFLFCLYQQFRELTITQKLRIFFNSQLCALYLE